MNLFILRIFSIATLLLAGGCATSLTMKAVDPGTEEMDMEFDYVADVTAAYRDEAGNVTVCVTGKPAGSNYWIPGDRAYSLHFPAAAEPGLRVSYHKTIPEYQITAEDVGGRCRAPAAGWMELPVRTVEAADFAENPGDRSWSGMSDKALKAFIESDAEAPAIYRFNYDPFSGDSSAELMTIVYVSEKPVAGEVRAVEIATSRRLVKGQPAYALLLPFAVVYDVVTFPLQLIVAFMHAG